MRLAGAFPQLQKKMKLIEASSVASNPSNIPWYLGGAMAVRIAGAAEMGGDIVASVFPRSGHCST